MRQGRSISAAAGMDCVVIITRHHREEFDSYPNVISFIEDYNKFALQQINHI